jgi:5'-nucleotidase
MSGTSNSLTLKKPLFISKKSKKFFHINGSPADCIHISRLEFFDFKPDLVISGINNGFNLGTDVFYSGTVAGAREGLLHRIPSLALSADYNVESTNYHKICEFIHKFIEKNQPIFIDMLKSNYFLNFNFPTKLNFNNIKITNIGTRELSMPPVETINPKGVSHYWIGDSGTAVKSNNHDDDFCSITNGSISISPITINNEFDVSKIKVK